jgi:hypothetical protein
MKKTKIISFTMAIALILALCISAVACAVPESKTITVPLPTVTGPIPVTADSRPFNPSGGTDFESLGYIEEEYFISGKANEYKLVAPDDTSNLAVEVRTPDLSYTTRMLLRRPTSSKDFSGNVIVEWLNPSASYDLATGWSCFHQHIMRNGDIWVGITCRGVTMEALKKFDPTRYEALYLARERAQAWDIFTQVGALLKSKDRSNPLRAFKVKYLYGHGYSQTGAMMITYINFFHPNAKFGDGTPFYDGYLPAAAGGPLYINDDLLADPSDLGIGGFEPSDPRRVIQPSGVPVVHMLTETEIAFPVPDFSGLLTRRPDSDTSPDLFRRYEIAGACHFNTYGVRWGAPAADQIKVLGAACPWCCNGTLSDIPEHFMFDACLANLEQWVREGTLPPKADRIQVEDGTIVRDEFGNARGGLRSPYVDVPIKTYSPMSMPCPDCEPVILCGPCSAWCVILGNMDPFDASQLKQLYGNHDGYVAKFNAAADKMFQDGFVTKADLELMKSEATESNMLR